MMQDSKSKIKGGSRETKHRVNGISKVLIRDRDENPCG